MTLKLNGTNSEAAPAYAGDDADTGLQCGTNELKLVTGGSARATVDSSGRVLVGTSSAPVVASLTPQVFIEGTSANTSALGIKANTNDTLGSFLALGKSRGTADGDNTIVQSGDSLGEIRFAGADGTDTVSEGARIAAVVDGTPGANDLPTSLVFYTAADGASFPNERMRILPSGTLKLVSSGGIDFSGIQTNASGMSSETLDSYEEGTWTPSTNQFTHTAHTSRYTKIGRKVQVFGNLSRNQTTSPTNSTFEISGFPFTRSTSQNSIDGTFWVDNGGPSSNDNLGGIAYFYSTTNMIFAAATSPGQQATNRYVKGNEINNTRNINFTCTYYVD